MTQNNNSLGNAKSMYCCNCGTEVEARLTDGAEVYPHRLDLHGLPFWKHDACGGFVGCHHKSKDRTKPLGCIPSAEIKELRKEIHAKLDPLWKNGLHTRSCLYERLSSVFGRQYHTAEIRSVDEASVILSELSKIEKGVS